MRGEPWGTLNLLESETALHRLLARVRYKDGWRFEVRNGMLHVMVYTEDSVTGAPVHIGHVIPIHDHLPDERAARLWLLERIFDIERHEAMEFFTVDDAAPFFPDHENGVYAVRERDVPVPVKRKPDGYRLTQLRRDEPWRCG